MTTLASAAPETGDTVGAHQNLNGSLTWPRPIQE